MDWFYGNNVPGFWVHFGACADSVYQALFLDEARYVCAPGTPLLKLLPPMYNTMDAYARTTLS